MEGPWGQATAKGNSTGVKTVGVKGHSYHLYTGTTTLVRGEGSLEAILIFGLR